MLTRAVILYDGQCGFCLQWVERVRRRDRSRAFDYVAAADRHARADLPLITDAALDHAMHLVLENGRVVAGGAAAAAVLRRLPGWRWLGGVLGLPGIAGVTESGYRWVARRRHRLGAAACEPATAAPPDPAAASSPRDPPSAKAGRSPTGGR